MKKFFIKENSMQKNRIKVIIDTDPGVDDSVCLINAFFDENIDIKLISTVSGNVSLKKGTRNALHLLDLFNLDIPVAKGACKPMARECKDAEFIHQAEGLGGYLPPKDTVRKPLEENAIDAIYRIISDGDGDIVPIILGPQTNFGLLFTKYPDVIKKIPQIVFMGGSPFGAKGYVDYISFNISSDPEAFKIVLDSGIPLTMIPSNIGRSVAHLTEAYVDKLRAVNDVGELLYRMYSMYWEPNYPDKRVATNDICALYSLVYPEIFKSEQVSVTVNTTDAPGKTIVDFNGTGHVKMITGANRDAFLSLLDSELNKMNGIDLKLHD